MGSMKRYLWQLAALTAMYFLATALVNVVVDPSGVFRIVRSSRLEPYKARLSDRASKAEVARSGVADVLIVGDSRLWVGLNPLHPDLRGRGTVYNCAFAAGTVYEGVRIIELARQTRPPRLVVWGFDPEILCGLVERHANPASRLTRLDPELAAWPYYRLHLFGLSTLHESIRVLQRARSGQAGQRTRQGQAVHWARRPKDYLPVFLEILAPCVRDIALPPQFETGADRLRPRLESWQADGTRLVLFFPPTHATVHETLFRNANRSRLAEQTVRELVECVAHVNTAHPDRPPIEVWDFRGFTTYHAEDVPAPGEPPMRWHWEALHFREELGDLILSRIFGRQHMPRDFGVRVTRQNVERHLAELWRQRQNYVRRHPEQVRIVSAAEQSMH